MFLTNVFLVTYNILLKYYTIYLLYILYTYTILDVYAVLDYYYLFIFFTKTSLSLLDLLYLALNYISCVLFQGKEKKVPKGIIFKSFQLCDTD